ncbi:three-Cys-motif partner protein TcmP [Halobellus sp. Atlit-38R]|uniref:three-Cys-motif partner protein TcmP n=1 Tax=Halobellus sp. Atlit-38R TaxID=2282131 RepID=UPI000EF2196E|nr:three-Cys-motif partner protein TcmP [Halobellus sp. Atlit-38R]RLM83673.1 three-Cys-motif partner protein TcmP [Halobellus sp. Atlit-38R]
MPLSDHNDKKWVYRPHTKAKHEVLGKYLMPWTNKLTSYNLQAEQENKVRVVDCFAGRGSYADSEGADPLDLEHLQTPAEYPGSPQLILDRLTDRKNQFDTAECVFIEADKTNYNILKETLENTTGIAENISRSYFNGKFQNAVLDIVESTQGDDCPTFFFIDPFGFRSLDYNVVTEIGSTPQFEFLITFMSRDMNRFLQSDDHQEALNTVFGTNNWASAIEAYDPKNWIPLVEYYTDRLEENGPQKTFEYMISEPETTQTIYYLVFGTNHPNGLKTMREVMNHCGTGEFAYAPKQPEYDREQARLPGTGEPTEQFLLDRFGEYIITFKKLVEISSNERKYSDDTESAYREAIRELERRGEVDIQRISSKETGIQGEDLIDFHESKEFIG